LAGRSGKDGLGLGLTSGLGEVSIDGLGEVSIDGLAVGDGVAGLGLGTGLDPQAATARPTTSPVSAARPRPDG